MYYTYNSVPFGLINPGRLDLKPPPRLGWLFQLDWAVVMFQAGHATVALSRQCWSAWMPQGGNLLMPSQ